MILDKIKKFLAKFKTEEVVTVESEDMFTDAEVDVIVEIIRNSKFEFGTSRRISTEYGSNPRIWCWLSDYPSIYLDDVNIAKRVTGKQFKKLYVECQKKAEQIDSDRTSRRNQEFAKLKRELAERVK